MSPTNSRARWICCQLGAREHYAVPRAVHRQHGLRMMLTDAWVRPGTLLRHLPGSTGGRLAERFHGDLEAAEVKDFTGELLQRELSWRLQRQSGWDLVTARNEWFQQGVADALAALTAAPSEQIVLFAHSYSARLPFRVAKATRLDNGARPDRSRARTLHRRAPVIGGVATVRSRADRSTCRLLRALASRSAPWPTTSSSTPIGHASR